MVYILSRRWGKFAKCVMDGESLANLFQWHWKEVLSTLVNIGSVPQVLIPMANPWTFTPFELVPLRCDGNGNIAGADCEIKRRALGSNKQQETIIKLNWLKVYELNLNWAVWWESRHEFLTAQSEQNMVIDNSQLVVVFGFAETNLWFS